METEMRATFVGLDSMIVEYVRKYVRSDGTLGLAPWTSNELTK